MKTLVAALAASIALSSAVEAKDVVHHVVLHVDQNDPPVMNMVLNNAENLTSYFQDQGDTAEIELVAYGPGLMMLMEDKSPVRDRIAAMALELPDMTFSACGNTIAGIEKKTGEKVSLMSEAHVVPSGVARLIELQEEGYSYVRP